MLWHILNWKKAVSRNTALAPNMPFCDLFLQMSKILQQPTSMTMPKCINCQPHCAFEPFLTAAICTLGAGAEGTVGRKSVQSKWHYHSGRVVIRSILCNTFTLQHVDSIFYYKGKDPKKTYIRGRRDGAAGAVFRDTPEVTLTANSSNTRNFVWNN